MNSGQKADLYILGSMKIREASNGRKWDSRCYSKSNEKHHAFLSARTLAMEHMKWECSAKSRTCSKMRSCRILCFMAKMVAWLVGMIRSQKCNLSRGAECEDCRGLVEPEEKPQLGRQKEALNFPSFMELQCAVAPGHGQCMAVPDE